MLVDLFEFQNKALGSLRERQVKAQRRYKQDGEKSIIPFTAPIKGLRMMPSCYG